VTVAGASIGVLPGTYTIMGGANAPTSTTFSITTVATTVLTSGTGTATVPAGSWDVTTLPNPEIAADGYNVPGGINYNADLPIDYIIPSVIDPVV